MYIVCIDTGGTVNNLHIEVLRIFKSTWCYHLTASAISSEVDQGMMLTFMSTFPVGQGEEKLRLP